MKWNFFESLQVTINWLLNKLTIFSIINSSRLIASALVKTPFHSSSALLTVFSSIRQIQGLNVKIFWLVFKNTRSIEKIPKHSACLESNITRKPVFPHWNMGVAASCWGDAFHCYEQMLKTMNYFPSTWFCTTVCWSITSNPNKTNKLLF